MVIIGIISIVIYIVAILIIHTNTYAFEKEKKIKFILIGIITILIVTWLIVSISANGIEISKYEYLKITKTTSILIFAPINTIFAMPYLGHIINKYYQEKIKQEHIKKRLLIFAIILVAIFIIEIGYIKDFQLGLLNNVK